MTAADRVTLFEGSRIWRFAFAVAESFELEMPSAAQILCVQVQNGRPCFWAAVNPAAHKEKRRFRVFGTGHPIDERAVHIGTIQTPPFVWHIAEVTR